MEITFSKLKFFRTYIGGSKKTEFDTFQKVQGLSDNSDCDWLEYRRILNTYINDTLNVIFSWKYLFEKMSLILLIFSFLLFNYPILSIIFLCISFVSRLTYYILKSIETKNVKDFNMCITITTSKIYKETGFILTE
jgi:hypothetical protein